MKSILSALFTMSILYSFGQLTTVAIRTIDRVSKDPITQVGITSVTNKLESKTRYTDKRGEVFFTVSTEDSIRFELDHVAYTALNIPPEMRYKGKPTDTLLIVVKMNFNKVTEFKEIIVRPSGYPDTVFRSERVSVYDFDFLPDGRMVLLTYPKNMRKETELVLFDGLEVKGEIPLEEKGLEIIRDFRGNPHVVTENTIFGIGAKGNDVQVAGIEKDYFLTYIAPIVDTTYTKYFFSNFNDLYPAFEYFTYDLLDSTYKKIAKIEDEFMMELYRSEYKWVDVRTKLWAKERENETGIDAEIWVGANYFTKSLYYKELYAPMFERNDSIFVFDHYKNWLFRYSKTGDLMDSLPIYHHLKAKETGWKKQILQDQTTGQIYLVYENAGIKTLRHFDAATGKLGVSIPLHFKYPEQLLIRSNKVYYTYRPFESPQKKFLYQEKLPLVFPAVQVNIGDEYTIQK